MPSMLGPIAEILTTIATLPNRRSTPRGDDLPGDFREWFDGGAVRVVTGTTSYHFRDGAVASIPVALTLVVHIALPDGMTFALRQNK